MSERSQPESSRLTIFQKALEIINHNTGRKAAALIIGAGALAGCGEATDTAEATKTVYVEKESVTATATPEAAAPTTEEVAPTTEAPTTTDTDQETTTSQPTETAVGNHESAFTEKLESIRVPEQLLTIANIYTQHSISPESEEYASFAEMHPGFDERYTSVTNDLKSITVEDLARQQEAQHKMNTAEYVMLERGTENVITTDASQYMNGYEMNGDLIEPGLILQEAEFTGKPINPMLAHKFYAAAINDDANAAFRNHRDLTEFYSLNNSVAEQRAANGEPVWTEGIDHRDILNASHLRLEASSGTIMSRDPSLDYENATAPTNFQEGTVALFQGPMLKFDNDVEIPTYIMYGKRDNGTQSVYGFVFTDAGARSVFDKAGNQSLQFGPAPNVLAASIQNF